MAIAICENFDSNPNKRKSAPMQQLQNHQFIISHASKVMLILISNIMIMHADCILSDVQKYNLVSELGTAS